MNTRKVFLIGIVLIAVVAMSSGCIQQPSSVSPEIEITIDIPKTTVAAEEEFEGSYTVISRGGAFEAYILDTCKREGYKTECGSRTILRLGQYSGKLNGCEIGESGSICFGKSFKFPGNYTFEVAVYDCAQIEEYGFACYDLEPDDLKYLPEVSPLSASKKIVTVTEK